MQCDLVQTGPPANAVLVFAKTYSGFLFVMEVIPQVPSFWRSQNLCIGSLHSLFTFEELL
jgi:hypothetical protein